MRNKREKVDRPRKGKDQGEREEPSQTRSLMENHNKRTGSHMALRQSSGRGRSLTRRRRVQAQNNLLTGGRAEKVDLEADQRPGEHKGENQEPPMTRSSSEDHPVRGRKPSHQPRYKTQAGRRRAGRPRQPQTAARAAEATLNPNKGQGRTLAGAKDNQSSRTYGGPSGNTPGGTGRAETTQTEAGGPSRN